MNKKVGILLLLFLCWCIFCYIFSYIIWAMCPQTPPGQALAAAAAADRSTLCSGVSWLS